VAKNVKAAYYSLVSALKFFKLFIASELITSSNTIYSVFYIIHEWQSAYTAEIRFSYSKQSIFLTNSIPSELTLAQIGPDILY